MNQEVFKRALTLKVADLTERVGGLSAPGKMPWGSFSTPAWECQVGSRLAEVEGSPCSVCYARKGRYSFKMVQNALRRRFERMAVSHWGEHMAALLFLKAGKIKPKKRYFRWFDSGDIQSVADLETIVDIAKLVPTVSFWLPTQERAYVKTWMDQNGTFPANLAVRISSTKMSQSQRSGTGLASMVSATDYDCPASRQKGQCLNCRKCWDKAIPLVTYSKH